MMEGWKEVKLEEIADVVGGGTPSTKEDSYWNGDVNWVTPADLSGYMFKHISAGERKITKLGLSKSSAKLHPKGTVLMTSRAPIGYLAIAGDEVATNQGFQSLRCKTDKVDNNFLYYILHLYKEGIQAIASGATFPEVSGKKVKGFKIKIPPLPTQRKIASILSAYDELIENNLKRIKIMEEKAQLTYEKWFSIKGTPNGWKEYKLGELIDFHIGGGWGEEFQTEGFPDPAYVIRGTDMDNLPLGSIKNVPNRWHKVSNLKSRRLQHGDIVFEVSGGSSYEGVAKTLLITEGLLNQFDGDVMCASFCKLMRPKSVSYSYALILFLKYLRKTKVTEIFEKRSASNIVNYNWDAILKFQAVKMPNNELLEQFNDIVEPMISSINNLGNQITKLKEARDILLPRLITGMIDVKKINLETLRPTTA